MAILRLLNEFSRESHLLALEPARECIASCSYCFATLNSKYQQLGKKKSLEDPGTFEHTINSAYSDSYDPANILQWYIRNKYVVTYANTCEPFQDVMQARGILKTLDQLSIPVFFQTKGINIDPVFDILKNFYDNSVVMVSIPSNDDLVIKRFEPGTPRIHERIRIIEKLAEAGFHVILGLSPYHQDWIKDPNDLVHDAVNWGVDQIFFDRLHINQRQRQVASDKVMLELARRNDNMWERKLIDHFADIYDSCIEYDIDFYTASEHGQMIGRPNTLASISPIDVYERGNYWSYHDGLLFYNLEEEFYDDEVSRDGNPEERDFNDSMIVEWKEVLALMESVNKIDQPFSYKSMSDLIAVDNIPAELKTFIGKEAPISEYFRALWNNPHKKQFGWRHAWTKIAFKPDGSPWTDEEGNLIMVYDPDYPEQGKTRVIEDIDVMREFTITNATNIEE